MKNTDIAYTIADINSDPYGFTFDEVVKVMGENDAKTLFFSLYKGTPNKKYQTISVKDIFKSRDTHKYAYALSDGRCIETVLIKRKDGVTVCVSTQVGCPVGCSFCESGRNGFIRNLTVSEIVQQVVLLKEKVNRIVFMGMGEPLYNYDNFIKALHILRDRNGMNFPTDGITVSTVGPLKELIKFREEHMKLQLTLSLHATTQQARNSIMPSMRENDINKIVEAVLAYSQRHNRKVVIAYLLLPGINDRSQDVQQLGRWFREKNVMINILEYNRTSNSKIRKPNKQAMLAFKIRLEQAGLEATLRVSHGEDIRAACGQLVSKYNKAEQPQESIMVENSDDATDTSTTIDDQRVRQKCTGSKNCKNCPLSKTCPKNRGGFQKTKTYKKPKK